MTDNYPTKEQILANPHKPDEVEYTAIRKWKRLFYNKQWSTLTTERKIDALKELIGDVCEARRIDRLEWPILIVSEHPWSYTPAMRTITMGLATPSVISTLHELGHYLHSSGQLEGTEEISELVACRYSVGIFKACFPKSYARLIWSKHTLVVPKEDSKE